MLFSWTGNQENKTRPPTWKSATSLRFSQVLEHKHTWRHISRHLHVLLYGLYFDRASPVWQRLMPSGAGDRTADLRLSKLHAVLWNLLQQLCSCPSHSVFLYLTDVFTSMQQSRAESALLPLQFRDFIQTSVCGRRPCFTEQMQPAPNNNNDLTQPDRCPCLSNVTLYNTSILRWICKPQTRNEVTPMTSYDEAHWFPSVPVSSASLCLFVFLGMSSTFLHAICSLSSNPPLQHKSTFLWALLILIFLCLRKSSPVLSAAPCFLASCHHQQHCTCSWIPTLCYLSW